MSQTLKNPESEVNVIYRPFPEQRAFHKAAYQYYARLISAGTGSGKTFGGLGEAFYWVNRFPGSYGLICEPTYKMLTRILIRQKIPDFFGATLEQLCANRLIKSFNKTRMEIEWWNRARWEMLGLDDPESAEGVDADYIWADEFRLVGGSGPAGIRKQEIALQVFNRRLRGSTYGRLHNYPRGLWFTTTPDVPGTPLHEMFEDPKSDLFEPDSKVFRWSLDANIYTPERWKDRVKAMHVPGSGLYKRFVLGIAAPAGDVTYAFDYSVHVIKKLPSKPSLRLIVGGIDWGWTNPACLLVIGFDYDFRAYVLEEFYQTRCDNETLIKEARDLESRWGRVKWICGHEEPKSIQDFNRAGLHAVKNETKRDEGVREMGGRFVVQGDLKPRIFVHEGCVQWIGEVQSYNAEVKQGDHAMDPTRYVLASVVKVAPAFVLG